ncbi:uncharacterized protein K452DRAFT_264870 [Aplosporella prunicola CBS 121167]|uniref:Glycerol-3-phosphate phosphatase n=1 Tax=Aplosporella prunicola CBS 121167 TaxID=1176127 RepID=A0A6A6BS58_9PEZI|nr:uncharacterized protein K452DRAFT_264870 [Aplosporella prunicola CBS 121167]KAF2145657.1 hypothetical protein K452DRAFT_264870 [Aplosporella prunicola CBS 121167]
MAGEADFSAPAEVHTFGGLLFDLDGTVIDSTEAIIKHWHKIGKQLGVDPNVILASSHGRRSIDTLKLYDPSLANMEYVAHIEGLIPKEFGQDAVEVPGSRALLDQIEALGAPWAIVTSGTRPLATGWLEIMKLAQPKNFVTAEDVDEGKPDPACYRLGHSKLGIPASAATLVLEDAPAGVRAGKAAGFKVVALATTHSVDQLKAAGADWIVRDMRSVRVMGYDERLIKVRIADSVLLG